MTSAKPLGRGRSRYPRGVAWATAMVPSFAPCQLGLSGFLGPLVGQGLLALAQQAPPDEGPVLGERLRDLDLADPVQVPDRPIQLLEGVVGRLPVAIGLVLLAVLPFGAGPALPGTGPALPGGGAALRHRFLLSPLLSGACLGVVRFALGRLGGTEHGIDARCPPAPGHDGRP